MTNFEVAFPNLRAREIVASICKDIAETCEHGGIKAADQRPFALGFIRGARLVADQIGDHTTRVYLARLLDAVNNRDDLRALSGLVEAVTGKELPVATAA